MLADFIAAQEALLCRAVLVASKGNAAQAARALGIHPTTFFEKCRKHGIIPDEFREPEKQHKPKTKIQYSRTTWLDHKLMMVLNALEDAKWNRAEAARMLGISYRTIFGLISVLREKGVDIQRSPHGSQAV
jgi:transcriptional regulator of acetoin/glycerol metabolism